jgi:Immunity protein 53
MTTLGRFQEWFASNCNGDWEHGAGTTITTLDNPGWSIDINIGGTLLEGRSFQSVRVERSEHDWLHASITETEFRARCGSKNLEECLTIFCNWAGV